MLIENQKINFKSAPEERNKTTFLDLIPKKFILLSIQFQKSWYLYSYDRKNTFNFT